MTNRKKSKNNQSSSSFVCTRVFRYLRWKMIIFIRSPTTSGISLRGNHWRRQIESSCKYTQEELMIEPQSSSSQQRKKIDHYLTELMFIYLECLLLLVHPEISSSSFLSHHHPILLLMVMFCNEKKKAFDNLLVQKNCARIVVLRSNRGVYSVALGQSIE